MNQASGKIPSEALKQGGTKNRIRRFDEVDDTVDRKRGKPPYSYISLIVMAILESPNRRQTLSGIIEHIQKRFPYYGENCPSKGWKNSIRHNLSLNDCFEKTSRDQANPSKGHFWRLHPRSAHMFEGGSFMRRKKRFRKDSDDFEDINLTPDSDVSVMPSHDVNMTSCDISVMPSHYVNMTPSSDVRESTFEIEEGSSLLPALDYTNDTVMAPCCILAESLSQKQLFIDRVQSVAYNARPGIVFSASPSSSICLICAGCTCY